MENYIDYTYKNNYDIIKQKLMLLKKSNKIPNIIFYGDDNSDKKEILKYFIDIIYDYDQNKIKDNVLIMNCSFNKGIKYIRDDLKHFCKTIINNNNGNFFKSIILLDADKLTIDAQSALRRCIEIYSHNTRFFIIVENKNKLLKPIISRFASIYIINYNLNNNNNNSLNNNLKKILFKNNISNIVEINNLTNYLYNNGYTAIDLYNYIKNIKILNDIDYNYRKYKILTLFLNIKKEIKNEKLLIFFLLKNIYFRFNYNLEI
jgi:DNA polymerase III delta prime subunit